MKTILLSFAAFAGLATAVRPSFHERRQASPGKTNLQFEEQPNTFTGQNEITFGKALDLNKKLFSINVNKAGDKDVLCQAFSEGKALGAFFPDRGLTFGTSGQLVTRIECDLPKFPFAASPPTQDATKTTSSATTSATASATPTSAKPNGPQIVIEFELERGATPTEQTFPFTSSAALDVDIKAVAARIVKIVGADNVKVDSVVCTTQKNQSSAPSKDIKAGDKVFFEEGNVVRITQITCSGGQ